jgi:thiamine biosynthesis protein ThiI
MKFLYDDQEDPRSALGYVFGTSLEDVGKVDVSKYELPIYFPTVGMSDDQVGKKIASLKEECKIN